MQINKLEVRVGTTINLGDYQSVKAEILIGADLDPREDDGEAFNTLRKKCMEQVIQLLSDNHPKNHRLVLDGGKAPAQLTATPSLSVAAPTNGPETAEEKTKRTRRTKEQIAADEAAAAAQKARVAAAQAQLGEEATGELGTEEAAEDDMASLLGDSIPDHPPVSAAEAKTIAGQLIKKLGGPSLVKLLKEFGAKDFPSLDAAKYGEFAAKAKAQLGTA